MSRTTYPEADRGILEQIVAAPRFRGILQLPTFAWQEIALIAGCYAALLTGCALYLGGTFPYWAVFAINTLAIYAIFTALHDATHGSLSSDRRINDWLGTLAAVPLFPGFTTGLYRYLHLEHHRHTGIPSKDPDEITVSTPMPWKLLAWTFLDVYWMAWYARRVPQRPASEVASAAGSAAFFIGWHVAWLTSPFAWEFVLLWLIPQRAGITLLVYLFAAIQHPEGVHQNERPLQGTRMFKGGWLAHLLMISQSQHLMHHLFPTVPYYRYNRAWRAARPFLRDREIVWDWPIGPMHHPGDEPESPSGDTIKARVVEVERVSSEVRAYSLEPAGERSFPPYSPGAHIDVHVAPGLVRQYSLTTPVRPDGRYRIGVKREENGRGGSRAVHERLTVGELIDIGPPRNHFPLSETSSRVLLVAGGIGITPLLAMAEALHKRGAEFTFHVCARNRPVLPFAAELGRAAYASRVRLHFDDGDPGRRLSARDLPEWDGQEMYLCGPQGFMTHVIGLAEARGWPASAIHTESFAAGRQAASGNTRFQVRLARSGKTLEVPAEHSLLNVLQEAKLPVHAVCTQGLCATCACKVIEGEVDHRDVVLSEEQRRHGTMTTCVSRAKGDWLVLDL